MKWYWYLIIGIAIVVIAYIVISQRSKKTISTDYDKCLLKNKNLAEGASCTNCIPSGSQMASFKGVIVNGMCQQYTR